MASEGRHFAVHAMICRQIWNLTCYALRESYVDGASLTRGAVSACDQVVFLRALYMYHHIRRAKSFQAELWMSDPIGYGVEKSRG